LQECDNDFNSDSEQVQSNQKTLMTELNSAISAFIKKDPIDLVENLSKDMENRHHPSVEERIQKEFNEDQEMKACNQIGPNGIQSNLIALRVRIMIRRSSTRLASKKYSPNNF
jgi:hypothetical protein